MKIKIVKEDSYVDTSKVDVGKTNIDPETGVKTTLSDIDPETGKLTWDVLYDVDPKFVYNKLDQLVDYMKKAEDGTELAKIRDILKSLKNKTHRLMTK